MDDPIRSAGSLSLVVPVHNEEAAIPAFLAAVDRDLQGIGTTIEMIFVDDGSVDRTRALLRERRSTDARIRVIGLSRQFGKEAAISAGLDRAAGDVVVPVDVDLQDPLGLIAVFLERWREGYDVVYGVRSDRATDTAMKRGSAGLFYRFFNMLAEAEIPENAGDFRLLDRRVVEALRRLPERNRFMKGLFAWVGFRSIGVPYVRAAREHGSSKFPFRRLYRLAVDGITGFSTLPLRVWTYVGAVVALTAFLFAIFVIAQTIIRGVDVPGYASTLTVVLFLGGIQLISLGIIGEYVGRLFVEAKQRPLYIVDEEI